MPVAQGSATAISGNVIVRIVAGAATIGDPWVMKRCSCQPQSAAAR